MSAQGKLLTIVCATKNVEATIESLLLSYKAQKNDETEFVIVDSCSVDDTANILEHYQNCIDRRLVESDQGIYEAWNKGVRLATGKFVCFIGADDVLACGAIAELLLIIKSIEDVDYIYGYNVATTNGIPKGIIGRSYRLEVLEKYMPMAHVMSAHRRCWLIENGAFDEGYKSSGDYDFILRMRLSIRVAESKKIFAYVEDNGVSRRSTMPIYEAYRAKKNNGVGYISSVIWLVRGVVGYYFRYIFRKNKLSWFAAGG